MIFPFNILHYHTNMAPARLLFRLNLAVNIGHIQTIRSTREDKCLCIWTISALMSRPCFCGISIVRPSLRSTKLEAALSARLPCEVHNLMNMSSCMSFRIVSGSSGRGMLCARACYSLPSPLESAICVICVWHFSHC